MAILNVMQVGEDCLKKKCKPVKEITPRIRELVQDMFDTMYQYDGVGLAAPQVGVVKRLFVIDVPEEIVAEEDAPSEEDRASTENQPETEPDNETETEPDNGTEADEAGYRSNPLVMINPEILETSGSQTGVEGCLSYLGMSAIVTRPDYVRVAFTNLDGDRMELQAEGLLARCILHENDHLDGKMYMEKAESAVMKNDEMEEYIERLKKENEGK